MTKVSLLSTVNLIDNLICDQVDKGVIERDKDVRKTNKNNEIIISP